jgi:predicted DNA-binding transcriptional regulator AlpA
MDKANTKLDTANGIMNGSVRLMTVKEVSKFLGMSISGVYLRIQQGTFPQPIKLSTHVSRWRSDVIAKWLDAQECRVGSAQTTAMQKKSVAAKKAKRANAQAEGAVQ